MDGDDAGLVWGSRKGSMDNRRPEQKRSRSVPAGRPRRSPHEDCRTRPTFPPVEGTGKTNRASADERQIYKKRSINLQLIQQDSEPVLGLKFATQILLPQYSTYVDDIVRLFHAFPAMSREAFGIWYESASGTEGPDNTRRVIGILFAADLEQNGLILLDWWVIPEFCSTEVFNDMAFTILLDVISPKSHPENSPFARYKKCLICHPLSNGEFQDIEMQILKNFGMQAACPQVKNVLGDDAARRSPWYKNYVETHHWWQWGPFANTQLEDRRFALLRQRLRRSRSSSQSRHASQIPPTINWKKQGQRTAMTWWAYRTATGERLLRSYSCAPCLSYNQCLGGNVGEYELEENRMGVIAVSRLSSKVLLDWGAYPGLQLHVLVFPRLEALGNGVIEPVKISGNLKTEVHLIELNEILMEEIFVDEEKSRVQVSLDKECPDHFSANIELKPLRARNVDFLESMVPGYKLQCRVQVICNMYRSGQPLPPQAIILKWEVLLQI